MDLDEVALNTLLAEGIDVPTAVAGSLKDREPELEESHSAHAHALGLVTAIVVVVLLLVWLT
jgi:hypothetical protein